MSVGIRTAHSFADLAHQCIRRRDIAPQYVLDHAARILVNVLATAVAAAEEPAVRRVIEVSTPHGVRAPAIPGTRLVASSYQSALATGMAGHFDDFDDTHLRTVIHPGASVLGAVWPLVWRRPQLSATQFLTTFAVGCELQLQIGNAISPAHYDQGWHITGTCGSLGAAFAAADTLSLQPTEIETALELAAMSTLGHRQAFGTDLKPFHAGKAAANGVRIAGYVAEHGPIAEHPGIDLAALLHALAGPDGWQPLADERDWQLPTVTFKTYPCGIVAHPGIDAAIRIRARLPDPDAIESVEYRCNPLVPELMGREQPETGLAARFSAIHGVSVGLIDGVAGLDQFSDQAAQRHDVARLRSVVRLSPDSEVERDAARLYVKLVDGTVLHERVVHARGSLGNPMSDEDLRAKVEMLTSGLGLADVSSPLDDWRQAATGDDTPARELLAKWLPGGDSL